MSFIVAGAGLLGLVAGSCIRALASGFGAVAWPGDRPRPGGDTTVEPVEPVEPGDGTAVEVSREASREAAAELRRAYRHEARLAFGAAVRGVPALAWPPLIELCAAAACALVAWRLAETPLLAAGLYAALAGCALAVIDWRTLRLPDAITLPSYPILAVLLAPSGQLAAGLLGGLVLGGVYAILWLARPGALGLGDVKLAGLAGMLTGALGLEAWLAGAVAGQFLGALYAVLLLITRRGTLKSQFPLGPFILLGALAAVLR